MPYSQRSSSRSLSTTAQKSQSGDSTSVVVDCPADQELGEVLIGTDRAGQLLWVDPRQRFDVDIDRGSKQQSSRCDDHAIAPARSRIRPVGNRLHHLACGRQDRVGLFAGRTLEHQPVLPPATGGEVSSAAPNDTSKRSHQMLTLVRPSISTSAGTA